MNITRNQSKLEVNTCKRPQARGKASDQVAIGFSFASDWLKGWREFSRPITERSETKSMQSRITFDTQLKIALSGKNSGQRCEFPYGLAVRIPGFHPGGPGSTPGMGIPINVFLLKKKTYTILFCLNVTDYSFFSCNGIKIN